jgi:hypothetical protein
MRGIIMKQEQKYKPNTAISMYEFGKRFPNAETARLYIEQQKWQGKAFCAFCNSEMSINCLIKTDFTNATLVERNSMSARTRFSKTPKYRLTSGCMPFTLLSPPEKAFPRCS